MATANSGNRKAFESRSVTLTVLKVTAAALVLVAAVGVAVRFILPDQWSKGAGWTQAKLDRPLLNLFQRLGKQYVENSDLDRDGKASWGGRIDGVASALREEKGTPEQREKIRGFYDGIAEKMRDGALARAELEPFEKDLDLALTEIEKREAKSKE